MHFVLQMYSFGAGDECLCAGDEHFSAKDERVENAHSNFTHAHRASYQRLPNKTYIKTIASHSYSPLKMGVIMLSRSNRYLDAQQRLSLQ